MQDEQEKFSSDRFVVGLGNPGREYARSRHNVGFMVVRELAARWQTGEPKAAFDGLVCEARPQCGDRTMRVRMLQPMTFMNLSGLAVRKMADFYKASLQDVLVVLDDLALPLGQLRLRPGGSAGGHNGLEDVLTAFGTTDLPRLRVGIGSPPEAMEAKDYVLSAFTPQQQQVVDDAVKLAADAAEQWIWSGMDAAMAKYNRRID